MAQKAPCAPSENRATPFRPPLLVAAWLSAQAARNVRPRSTSYNHTRKRRKTLRGNPRKSKPPHRPTLTPTSEERNSCPKAWRGQQVPATNERTATVELGPRDGLRPSPGAGECWHRTGERCAHRKSPGSTGTGPRRSGPTTWQRSTVHRGSEGCSRMPLAGGHRRRCCVCSGSLSRRPLR